MGLLDYTIDSDITIEWLTAHDWRIPSQGLFSTEPASVHDGIIIANKTIENVSCGALSIHIILQFVGMNGQSVLTVQVVGTTNMLYNHPLVTMPAIVASDIKTIGDLFVAERVAEDRATEQTMEFTKAIEGKGRCI